MKILGHAVERKHVIFTAIFAVLALVAQTINFSPMVMPLGVSESPFFTLFQFFAPIAGAFLGVFGAIAVLASELAMLAYKFATAQKIGLWSYLGLLPILFATLYFANAKNYKASVLVPIAAIAMFLLNPVGQQVWYFALFWTIPVIAAVFFSENLLAKSFGATLTAHAVGGAMWIWAFPTTAAYWNALIPIVAIERSMFAIGIAASFIAMTTILHYVVSTHSTKHNWAKQIANAMHIDAKYALIK